MTNAEKVIEEIKTFSRVFIERPRFAMVISIVLTIAGVMCIGSLPVTQYPPVTPPQITVRATYPGANAQEVARTVAVPLEEEMNGVDDMLYLSSECTDDGSYVLNVTFDVGTDRDLDMVKVQNRIQQATSKLPVEVQQYGLTVRAQSSDTLGFMAIRSPNQTLSQLDISEYIYSVIRPVLLRIPGVGEAMVYGPRVAMRVWLDAQRMAAIGMNTEEVMAAISKQNIQASLGRVGATPTGDGGDLFMPLVAVGRLSTPEEFDNIVVRTADEGGLVFLRDIARTEVAREMYGFESCLNNGVSVSIALNQKPGSNAIATMDEVRQAMDELKSKFPDDMEVVVPYDATKYVRVCIEEIVTTLGLTFLLVVFVCYLFLQDWRATLVPALTIPVSLCATFLVLQMLNYTINTLTLFGLVLAIGVVVDDAIVVVERVLYLMETRKLSPRLASIQAMSDVTSAVIATTLVLLGIFVPIGFLGGITGMIYKQFAVTLSAAVIFSTVNALTLSPALCATILQVPKPHRRGPFAWFNKALDWTRWLYVKMAGGLARRTVLSLLLLIITVLSAYYLFTKTPTSFLPEEDQGVFFGLANLPEGLTLPRNEAVARDATQIALSYTNDINSILTICGFSLLGGRAENLATYIIELKTWDERPRPEQQINAIKNTLALRYMQELPDAMCHVFVPPAIPGLGANGGVDVRLESINSMDPVVLEKMMNETLGAFRKSPMIESAFSSFTAQTPQLKVNVDRVKCEMYKVAVGDLFATLQNYLGSRYINDINLGTQINRVMIQADWDGRANPEDVLKLYVKSATGAMVPIGSLVALETQLGARFVTRHNLYPSAAITITPRPGVPSGVVMQETKNILDNMLTKDFKYEWAGISYQEAKTSGQAIVLVMLALVFGYLFLVAQYESWTIPLPVMLSIFVASTGALIGLQIEHLSLSVYAQLGMVLLVGLASKNAILIVEFAKTKREEGYSIVEAAKIGAGERLRAVLMTALTFVLGVLPMVYATGAGAGSRTSIGVTVYYGMLVATVFGIVLVPGLYAAFQRFREWGHKLIGKPLPETLRDEASVQ